MSIESFRFRAEGSLVVLQVLQVLERATAGPYTFDRSPTWRDAQVTDLLDVSDVINARRLTQENDYRKTP